MTLMPASRNVNASCQRFALRPPGRFVCASSSRMIVVGCAAKAASRSKSSNVEPAVSIVRGGMTRSPSRIGSRSARPLRSIQPTATSMPLCWSARASSRIRRVLPAPGALARYTVSRAPSPSSRNSSSARGRASASRSITGRLRGSAPGLRRRRRPVMNSRLLAALCIAGLVGAFAIDLLTPQLFIAAILLDVPIVLSAFAGNRRLTSALVIAGLDRKRRCGLHQRRPSRRRMGSGCDR